MDRILKFTVIILLVIAVVLIAVLALILTMPDLPTTSRNDHICLPGKNGYLKCDTTADLLHEYLERKISNKYEKIKANDVARQQAYLKKNKVRLMNIYGREFWEMKPAAKLAGKDKPKQRNGDKDAEMTPIREWKHGKELNETYGFMKYGIRYRNGRLVVPVAGTYSVYSLVDFFVQCDPSTGIQKADDASKPIKHGIYKFNILDKEETEIISGVQSHQISTNKYMSSYSSYISSLADLKAGDEISVKVSNIAYLKYTEGNTFGLHLL